MNLPSGTETIQKWLPLGVGKAATAGLPERFSSDPVEQVIVRLFGRLVARLLALVSTKAEELLHAAEKALSRRHTVARGSAPLIDLALQAERRPVGWRTLLRDEWHVNFSKRFPRLGLCRDVDVVAEA